MKNILFTICTLLISTISLGQSIVGEWETYDDETNELKSIVQIYQEGRLYFGKIKTVLAKKRQELCTECEGDKKNTPIIGLVIIENMKFNNDEYTNGTILDPESGTTYKCLLTLENVNKLKVRGYIGFALLGRTQYWKRKQS